MGLFKSISSIWGEKHKELYEAETHDAIRLRMHRAMSWMRKAQEFEVPDDHPLVLRLSQNYVNLFLKFRYC